jgi:hypothetical protein
LPSVIKELGAFGVDFVAIDELARTANARGLGHRGSAERLGAARATLELTRAASPLVLGIDGGNSKVDLALLDGDGRLRGAAVHRPSPTRRLASTKAWRAWTGWCGR